jgi:hypothetical protein
MTGSNDLRPLAEDIIAVLAVDHYDTDHPLLTVFHPLATVNQLVATGDARFLTEVFNLATLLSAPVDRLSLSHTAAQQRRTVISALHSEGEWVVDNPDNFQAFHHFLCIFDTAWSLNAPDRAETINSAKNLARAYQLITSFHYPEGSHIHGTAALSNTHYIALLLAHEDHLPELLEYRKERNMDQTHVMEPLDDEDFARYLIQGPVRNGWL